MSTGYAAGLDTSNVQLAYVEEVTFAVAPTATFQAIRVTKEGFASSKNRTRPPEINPYGYAQHAITTQQTAVGSFDFGLSYQTFDDFLSSGINSTAFPADLNVTSSASPTIAIGVSSATSGANGTFTITASTGTPFANVKAGMWIGLLVGSGVSGVNAATNGVFRVTTATNTVLTCIQQAFGTSGIAIAAIAAVSTAYNGTATTPATAGIKVCGSDVRNGVTVRTFTFEKNLNQITDNLFLQYLGSYVSQISLNMQVGSYVTGSANLLIKSETSATTSISTGGGVYTAPPTGRIMDNIGGFKAFAIDDSPSSSVLQSMKLQITKKSARSQFGIGSAAAVGMGRGTVEVSGTLSMYFADFSLYNYYLTEADHRISFKLQDNAGNAYVFTLPTVSLMNPQIVAGGPDTDLVAQFTLEGNPAPSTDAVYFNGALSVPAVTIQIDRIPGY